MALQYGWMVGESSRGPEGQRKGLERPWGRCRETGTVDFSPGCTLEGGVFRWQTLCLLNILNKRTPRFTAVTLLGSQVIAAGRLYAETTVNSRLQIGFRTRLVFFLLSCFAVTRKHLCSLREHCE